MRTLQGHGQREDDPIVLHMSAYLLTLDEFCDAQHSKLKQQIRRAEVAEVMVRRLQVRLAAAEARTATAQSSEDEAKEALKEAEDQHSKELKEAHLVGRARRRMQVLVVEDPPLLDKIPVAQGSGKRKSPSALVAPPPTEVSPETSDPEAAEEPLP